MLDLIEVLTLVACVLLIYVSWPFFRRSLRLIEFVDENGWRALLEWSDEELEAYMTRRKP